MWRQANYTGGAGLPVLAWLVEWAGVFAREDGDDRSGVSQPMGMARRQNGPSPFASLLGLALAVLVVGTWSRRHGEAPLRGEMRARPVADFRAGVDVKASVLGMMLSARGRLDLIVRGDAFEVSHPFPLARLLFGQQYAYRAGDTTVEVVPGLLHDWIEVYGRSAGPTARIWIGRRNLNRQIWDALVRAGAHPIGSSPPS